MACSRGLGTWVGGGHLLHRLTDQRVHLARVWWSSMWLSGCRTCCVYTVFNILLVLFSLSVTLFCESVWVCGFCDCILDGLQIKTNKSFQN